MNASKQKYIYRSKAKTCKQGYRWIFQQYINGKLKTIKTSIDLDKLVAYRDTYLKERLLNEPFKTSRRTRRVLDKLPEGEVKNDIEKNEKIRDEIVKYILTHNGQTASIGELERAFLSKYFLKDIREVIYLYFELRMEENGVKWVYLTREMRDQLGQFVPEKPK